MTLQVIEKQKDLTFCFAPDWNGSDSATVTETVQYPPVNLLCFRAINLLTVSTSR